MGASFSMTGPTHLPHSLQGKKLANEGAGTASSGPNGLSTGRQMGVTYKNRTNCKLPCCVELHSAPDKHVMHLTDYTRLHKYSIFFHTPSTPFYSICIYSYLPGIRMHDPVEPTEYHGNRQINTGQ